MPRLVVIKVEYLNLTKYVAIKKPIKKMNGYMAGYI